MTCLREVVLAHGPTTCNAADSELPEETEKRRRKVQCQLLDIYRRQEVVQEQASLPYSSEGRQKYLKMLGEQTRLEMMFEERLTKIKTISVPVKVDQKDLQAEQAQESTPHIISGCFKGSS